MTAHADLVRQLFDCEMDDGIDALKMAVKTLAPDAAGSCQFGARDLVQRFWGHHLLEGGGKFVFGLFGNGRVLVVHKCTHLLIIKVYHILPPRQPVRSALCVKIMAHPGPLSFEVRAGRRYL